jgi:dGTPase|uniref:Deoxyguanosinetriphosphate triphosphohydrolase-like protein n=1 Tax=Candidatus Caldatribacterium californiense TaxID=1454726 RepID=A0A7V3YHE8_9BACT
MVDVQSIKRFLEEKERELLSPFATLSTRTRGRAKEEKECELRTCFQRDRDRILHSKAFRRLKHKSQVFLSPEGDHYRTRLTHTLEVSQIARTIARALRLNEDLVEAISLGHDLGHTPFGHAGEEALNEIHPGGFKHNEQSLRVVDYLERDGEGLNLTWEVRDGIVKHSKTHLACLTASPEDLPATLEGQVVRWADVIAYVNHDIDDALRARVIRFEELPKNAIAVLGETHRERINTMVWDIVVESFDRPEVRMSEQVQEATETLRNFLFERVYFGPEQWQEREKAKRLVKHLYEFFAEHPEVLEAEYTFARKRQEDLGTVICDFISGMTDRYALYIYRKYFIPSSWPQEGWRIR